MLSWIIAFLLAWLALALWRRRHIWFARKAEPETDRSASPREFGRRQAPVAPSERRITETVSVVLRRQVPPRDEAPRSWLGGLPMMPEDVPWPRSVSAESPEHGERPLHFVAQVACEDLPAELWGGLGPREGWLLLFIDPNQGAPDGNDAFRVLYVATLGTERAAPADLGPVHDGVYTGARYDYCAPGEVPNVWRRWPVDCVTVTNTIRPVGSQRMVAAPENFAASLYPDQPIAADGQWSPVPEPFTWRGALHVLNGLSRSYSTKHPDFRVSDRVVEGMRQPGLRESVLRVIDEKEQHWLERNRAFVEGPEPADDKERHRWTSQRASAEDRKRQRAEIAALLDAHPDADSLLEYFRRADAERKAWFKAAQGWIAAERDAVLLHPLDTPMEPAQWQAIQDRLRQHSHATWIDDWVEWQGVRSFGLREIVSRLDFKHVQGVGELIADYYADPARRGLVPPALIAQFEPHWRRLEDNIPHRMGGYHDGVQSDPEPGPAKELLLFQIASDPAMNWCWGDVGAYYVFIAPDDFEAADLGRANMSLECH